MMLAIDIGIKNLAYCIAYTSETDGRLTIHRWSNVNLAQS